VEHYQSKTDCVLCNGKELINLVTFPETPIANQLFTASTLPPEGQEKYPLGLVMCGECRHIQIDTLINPNILFFEYPYVSNSSQTMAKRLEDLRDSYVERFDLGPKDFVLEVGSNDGYLLSLFQRSNVRVLGVDPAVTAAEIATRSKVPTVIDFFSSEVAEEILINHDRPSLIIANNVLAHSDDLQNIFKGISLLMNKSTSLVIEFSYVVDIFEKLIFDTIYHEHTSYHSIEPLVEFLSGFGLEIYDVERFDAHGGSARVFIKRHEGSQAIEKSVQKARMYEEALGIHNQEIWLNFDSRIKELRNQVKHAISKIKSEGETLAGYGVPAKFSTLFYVLQLDEKDFDFIVDDNSLKIGRYAPGTSIMIKDSADVVGVDNVLIFSWNYAESISAKIRKLDVASKRIILPLPEFLVKNIKNNHSG